MPDIIFDCLQSYLTRRYPGAMIADFQFLVSGYESEVYTFTLYRPGKQPEAFVLRLYPGDGAVDKMTREARGLDGLHHAGYPVPAMLLYEVDPAVLGKPFTILEKLEGKVLWPLLAGSAPDQADALLDRFGSLLARLHQLDWRPFTGQAALYQANPTSLLDEWLSSYRALYTRFEVRGFLAILDWLEQRKSDITVQPAVVHLDFHANNVFLCQDGSLAVIDWTQIAVSDFRADLSWTLLVMGDLGQPRWGDRILQAYTQAFAKSVEDLDYFKVMSYTKLLASTAISLRTSPKELGMRPETVKSVEQQAPLLSMSSERIEQLTGIRIPEVKAFL